MKKRLFALVLALILLLSGCQMDGMKKYYQRMQLASTGHNVITYDEMEYSRPDMTYLEQVLAESCATAAEGKSLDAVIDAIYAFYDVYDAFYTNASLAYLRYSADLRDTYWSAEYEYCAGLYAQADAALEELYRALAASPVRQELEGDDYFDAGYFDQYEGETIWDEGFIALLEEEIQIQSEYYDIQSQWGTMDYLEICDAYGEELIRVLIELIGKRQEIAAYVGYDSYPQFAYDFYHYRDYTPEEALAYTGMIAQELVPLYRKVSETDVFDLGYSVCTVSDCLKYVETCAEKMGGAVEDAFMLLDCGELYDLTYSEYKSSVTFETYLDYYYEPFIFMNPTGTVYDKLSLVHEFGHFAHDYVCWNSYAGTDVAEVLSQGMEYLSLCYGEDNAELETLKMADSLCLYVEQAAYAAFEHQMYDLTGEDLTAENLRALYSQVVQEFGMDCWEWDDREFVTIAHFYVEPMYIISYVVSNDAALQLYQMEVAQSGAGLACYEEMLTSEESYFCYFVETMGLESPFTPERLADVRQTLEEKLG